MTSAEPTTSRAELQEVALVVHRYVSARSDDAAHVDDIVQETAARLLERRPALEEGALLPYALVTARNLLHSHHRAATRARRHAHRVIDLREPERPDELLVALEEQASMRAALARLSPSERMALLHHELGGATMAELAADRRTSPGAMAVRLAGTRAKLRVDYLVAFRGVELPTERCRPVLVALSAGDTRRQRALDAGAHLATCPTCGPLSEPLLQRERALAGWLPLGGLAAAGRLVRERPRTSAAGAAAAAAVVVAAVLAGGDGGDRPAPAARPPEMIVSVDGRPLDARPQALAGALGRPADAAGAVVVSVAADEGFWLATDGGGRVWVQLLLDGESPVQVHEGQRLRFTGRVVAHGPGFAASVGVSPEEGAEELDRAGAHLEVPADGLQPLP